MIIKRALFQTVEPYFDSPEAIIVTGMRRVGKTVFLRSIFEIIPSTNKLFLDLENPLNQKYFEQQDFEQIKFAFEALGLSFSKPAYIFLDEIQLIRNIPQIVKYLMDHYPVKFFLTGSASFYLKNLFSESLAGRKYLFELYPLSFAEFLALKEANLPIPPHNPALNNVIFETISRYYREYIDFGGFPQVAAKTSAQEKKEALSDIFASYFQLEVKQLSDFRKINKLRDLILLLSTRIGSKLDIHKLSQELSLSRQTVYDYIAFLEGTYFIKLITPFTSSRGVEIKKMPKLYACDSGLINIISPLNEGALFEQAVFQNLRLKGELNFYQRKSGVEIDFILNKKEAYEVKIKPYEKDLRKLADLSRELGLSASNIVSLKHSNLKNVIYGFEL